MVRATVHKVIPSARIHPLGTDVRSEGVGPRQCIDNMAIDAVIAIAAEEAVGAILAGFESGVRALLAAERLDAVVAPSNGPSWPTDLVSGDRYTGGNSSVAAVAGVPPAVAMSQELAAVLVIVKLSTTGAPWPSYAVMVVVAAVPTAAMRRSAPLTRCASRW